MLMFGVASRHRRRARVFGSIAGLTILVLFAATGHTEPFPDPGDGLEDAGTPGDPPPPDRGKGGHGPGSPDAGGAVPHAPRNKTCQVRPSEHAIECFKLDGAAQFEFANDNYPKAIIEKSSDGTVLRTTFLHGNVQGVISFMQNTTVTVENRSPYPRFENIVVRFTNARASQDFLCEVRIHDPYFPHHWQNHTKCTWTGANSWIAKFTNYGDRPVDVNEWYGAGRHGRTEVKPGEPKIIPLHSHGTFWVGAGGRAGRPIKIAVTEYQIGNGLPEMWVRDRATFELRGGQRVAVNQSQYPIRLSWERPRPGNAMLPPYGRVGVEYDLNNTITGQKEYGNGEVARVLFLPTSGGVDNHYLIVRPFPNQFGYPLTTVEFLTNTYRSVQLENLGPSVVDLVTWFIPYFSHITTMQLQPGDTLTLPLWDYKRSLPTTLISGVVHPGSRGHGHTNVAASRWVPCLDRVCNTLFTPTLDSLTGSARGVDEGDVQVQLKGQLSLAPAAAELDLSRAGVDLLSLLDEDGEAGELVEALASGRVHLVAGRTRGATTEFSETPPRRARPIFNMKVTRPSAGMLEFTLNVKKTRLSHAPRLCSEDQPSVTYLTTRFIISDGERPPVEVAALKAWECVGGDPQAPSELQLR